MQLSYNKNAHNESQIINFLSNLSNNFYLSFFTILSTLGLIIPYNSLIKLIYAIFILVSLLFFTIKKPDLVLPIFFLTSVAPIRIYTGVVSKEITFIVLDHYAIIIAGLMFIYLIKIIIDKKIQTKQVLPLVLIILLMVLSFFYTDEYTRMTYYKGSFWCIVLYYMIVPLFIKNKSDFNEMIKGYVFGIFQAAIVIIYGLLFIKSQSNDSGTYDRNYFCAYLILLISSVLVYMLTNKRLNKNLLVLGLLSIFPCVIQIFQEASRTAFICLILLISIYVLINIKNVKNLVILTLLISVFMIFIYDSNLTQLLFERLKEDDMASGNGRVDIAIAMLKVFFKRGFFGKMFGSGYNSVILYVYGDYYTTHNSFISFLLHYGIIGFVSFVYIFIRIMLKLIKNKKLLPYLIYILVFFIYCITLEAHIKAEFILIFIGLFSIIINSNNKVGDNK